jgi:hypothetical protein
MAEAFRICGNLISQKGVLDKSIRISCYRSGIPKIIGRNYKDILEGLILVLNSPDYTPDRAVHLVRALFSVLSIFRACSPEHVVKFSTITGSFTGLSRTFDRTLVRETLDSMNLKDLKVSKPYFFKSNKSGANAMIA